MADITLRAAGQHDLELLWRFLAMAAYEPDAEAAKAVPFVGAHLVGWQRAGDFGFVAEDGASAVGAVWARQFAPAENPAFFIDWRTPEISIAVAAQARGRGVGAMLLDAMIAEAARRGLDLTLNVRHDNPARRLYGRKGFQVIPGAEVPNRVGGTSLAMLLRTAH